jgi:signal peptidase I
MKISNIKSDRIKKILSALNYVGKIISSAILVLLVFIGMFLIYYVISAKIVSKSAGVEPKISLYTIISGSMVPNINVYDIVLDVRVDSPKDIKVGDIITFISTSSISKDFTVTHRVINIIKGADGKYEYVTKGDANPVADSDTAKYDNVIGKVKMRIPQVGRIQFFLATKMGWFIVVLLPALGVIIYDILKLVKMIGAKKNVDKINDNPEINDINAKEREKQIRASLEKLKNSNYQKKLNELKEFTDNKKDE